MRCTHTLDRSGERIRVTFEAQVDAPLRGWRDSLGVPLEPDDPLEVSVDYDTVTDDDGDRVELSEDEMMLLDATAYGQAAAAYWSDHRHSDDD